jgi:hypothetical protein
LPPNKAIELPTLRAATHSLRQAKISGAESQLATQVVRVRTAERL